MKYSIGIDLHKKTSHVIVRDSRHKVQLLDKSIRSWPRRFQEVLKPYRPANVLIEASTMSRWVAPWLRKLGHEVIVGDPNFALMYAARSTICKNDRNDARALAFALENGHYHAVYEPNAEQQPIAELLGTRTSQVRRRTAAINRVRALYAARGEELPSCEADTFRSCVKRLPRGNQVPAAEPLLDELAGVFPTGPPPVDEPFGDRGLVRCGLRHPLILSFCRRTRFRHARLTVTTEGTSHLALRWVG